MRIGSCHFLSQGPPGPSPTLRAGSLCRAGCSRLPSPRVVILVDRLQGFWRGCDPKRREGGGIDGSPARRWALACIRTEYALWATSLTYLHTVGTQQRQVPPQIAGPCLFTCAAIGRGWKSRWLNGRRLTCVDLALSGCAGPAEGGTLGAMRAIGRHMNHRMQSAVERPMDAACLLPGAGAPYRTCSCCQAERRVSRLRSAVALPVAVCWAGLGSFNPEALDLLLSSGPPPLRCTRPAGYGSSICLKADKSPRSPVETSHTNLEPSHILALLHNLLFLSSVPPSSS